MTVAPPPRNAWVTWLPKPPFAPVTSTILPFIEGSNLWWTSINYPSDSGMQKRLRDHNAEARTLPTMTLARWQPDYFRAAYRFARRRPGRSPWSSAQNVVVQRSSLLLDVREAVSELCSGTEL